MSSSSSSPSSSSSSFYSNNSNSSPSFPPPPPPDQLSRLFLDFSSDFDVSLFDSMCESSSIEGDKFNVYREFMVVFQNNDLSWQRVDIILEKSHSDHARFIALMILTNLIKNRWKSLPNDQREGIRNFIVKFIIDISSNSDSLTSQQVFLKKLNSTLVEILKQDWPHRWSDFIPSILSSSQKSQSLCTNNMEILSKLSEEIFDYSNGIMTTAKILRLKSTLNDHFGGIFDLMDYVLNNSQNHLLTTTTLKTLLKFLSWIPLQYVFETDLIRKLCMNFFPQGAFQNDSLACLAEISALKLSDSEENKYSQLNIQMFFAVIEQTQNLIIQNNVDVNEAFQRGGPVAQTFIRNLSNFITSFLKCHLTLLERTDENTRGALMTALLALLKISRVNDSTIFKICLDYWAFLVADLYQTSRQNKVNSQSQSLSFSALSNRPQMDPRVSSYSECLKELRVVMIAKMAKPEEVLVVENEDGTVGREQMKGDTEILALYKSMRECLIYLTHLDSDHTQRIMLEKLSQQVEADQSQWDNQRLNTLCWAIGSISGSLSDQNEKNFLVHVIKDLLKLCEMKKGKDLKAIIASNIMYVVGQYPRFLRQHWKFLRTVVNKLFEFMHEKHPGVQDMSVETFLKISRRCAKKFIVVQQTEQRAFIEDICLTMVNHINDLSHAQIRVFYEACGEIIQSENDAEKRESLVSKLMEMPNQSWSGLITAIQSDSNLLFDGQTCQKISFVLQTNARVAQSLRGAFSIQLSRLYIEMLKLYEQYAEIIRNKLQSDPIFISYQDIKYMRTVKRETINLIRVYVSTCRPETVDQFMNHFLPPLVESLLDDYKNSIEPAREYEVLALFADIIGICGQNIIANDTAASVFFPKVFDCLFEGTLPMISQNMEDHPDHREHFYRLLQATCQKAFEALLKLNGAQFGVILDAITWGFKHLERNAADSALQTMSDVINNISISRISNDFFQKFYVRILRDIFEVMTDKSYRAGFRVQSIILAKLFQIVNENHITAPIWLEETEGDVTAYPNNASYVRSYTSKLFSSEFPNLSPHKITNFVSGLFSLSGPSNVQQFKTLVRDFLIELTEHSGENEENDEELRQALHPELYLEENQNRRQIILEEERKRLESVPGLQFQYREGNANGGNGNGNANGDEEGEGNVNGNSKGSDGYEGDRSTMAYLNRLSRQRNPYQFQQFQSNNNPNTNQNNNQNNNGGGGSGENEQDYNDDPEDY